MPSSSGRVCGGRHGLVRNEENGRGQSSSSFRRWGSSSAITVATTESRCERYNVEDNSAISVGRGGHGRVCDGGGGVVERGRKTR